MEEFNCPEALGNHFPFLIQKNLPAIEAAFGLEISLRGNKIMFAGSGAPARKFKKYLQYLELILKENGRLQDRDIQFSLNLVADGKIEQLQESFSRKNIIKVDGKEVFPKPSTSAVMSRPSRNATWFSASARPEPAKHFWPLPWP